MRFKVWQVLIFALLIFFVAVNIMAFLNESKKWANHPYPEAKQYLVKANIVFGYGVMLTQLPFVNEKSIIMKPIKILLNHYVEEAKKHIPENDAEREMYWYVFRYYFIQKHARSVNLDGNNTYSTDEIKKILDEVWQVIEGISTKDIRTPLFRELRYAGMGNLSSMYLVNEKAYYENWHIFNVTDSYKNDEKILRYYRLFGYLVKMDNFYKDKYPEIVRKHGNQMIDNRNYYRCTSRILGYEIFTQKYKANNEFCNPEKNMYLKYYLDSRKYLVDFVENKNSDELKVNQTKKYVLNRDNENQISEVCTQLNIKKEDY